VQSQSTHSSEIAPRRRRKIKTPWIVAGVVLIVILGFWYRSRSKKPAEPTVETAAVSVANVSATVSATGTLQPFTAVDVKSRASGTVLEMAVEEGTVVKKGQLICLIDRQDTLEAYQQAQAGVSSAQAALAQAQENAQLQNSSIGPQIQQSAQALAAAQAKVKQSKETLTVQKATSRTDIEQAQSNVKSAQAKLAQAQASAAAQPTLTNSAIAQAQANVDASKANLDSAKQALAVEQNATLPQQAAAVQAQVDQAKSAVQTAQQDLTRQEGLLAKGYVAQTTVDTARNQLVAAQSTLKTAQAQLDTLKNQQSAQLQDFKARVQAAQGSLQQAQAGLKTAQANSVQNVVAQKNVTAAEAALKQSQAALASAIANQRQVAVQQAGVESSQAQARQAAAALQAAKANTALSSVRAQDVVQAQAKLAAAQITAKNAQLNLDQTRVVAPSDGIILKKYVDAGTIIQSGSSGFSGGTAIVNLANVSRMYVDVEVDEADIARVKTGQPVSITLDAYPDSLKHGVVRKVYPEAEVDQNVTYVHAQVELNKKDVNSDLRPLMNATCDFTVAQAKDVLAVPSDAIKDVGKKSTVTVIKDPKKPLWEKTNQEQKTVTLGVAGDSLTEVKSGLKKGDIVVTKIIPVAGADADTGSKRGRGLGRF
jgi:HlyD family secretion protein